jgi:carbamoyl-phosphate synthase large subunit
MFFAVWENAPIKTTLLRELDEFCEAEYVTFKEPEERLGADRPEQSWAAG